MNDKQGHVANHDVSGYASNGATFWWYRSVSTEWRQISGTVSETGSSLRAQITALNGVLWWVILRLCRYLDNVASSGKMNGENDCGLIEGLSRELPGRKKGSHETSQSRYWKSWGRFKLCTTE
jgi:hypothetical protein